MTLSEIRYRQQTKKKRPHIFLDLLDKGTAILAFLNLLLVLFDLSYIPLRNFWLQGRVQVLLKIGNFEQEIPQEPLRILPFRITDWYDLVKAIEPHRDTQNYLDRLEDFNTKIEQITRQATGEERINEFIQEPKTIEKNLTEIIKNLPDREIEKIDRILQKFIKNLPPKEAEELDNILQDLRDRSEKMIDNNPFQLANKTGTLERIKNKMRLHIFDTEKQVSSTQAFNDFWNREYLTENGWWKQSIFFNNQIKPLIATNYYRPVGENGQFIDNFGLLDFPFFLIFGLDFLLRTALISRRHIGVTWLDAMLWRWYDIFLLIPVFRWLRIIPVTIRLNQSGLIDLRAIQRQVSQGFVASIAQDITEVIVVRVINRTQDSIRQGEISNVLSQNRQYIDLNQTNESLEIAKLIAQLLVYRVLPKIRPDIEALLKYTIEKLIHQSSAYQRIEQFPGIEQLQANLTEQLVKEIYQVLFNTLNKLLEDPKFNELLESLVTNLSQSMGSEIQAKQSIARMESLLIDLLEEIKINYVESLSEEDMEEIFEQTRALRQGVNNN